jgi:hypothetical protein
VDEAGQPRRVIAHHTASGEARLGQTASEDGQENPGPGVATGRRSAQRTGHAGWHGRCRRARWHTAGRRHPAGGGADRRPQHRDGGAAVSTEQRPWAGDRQRTRPGPNRRRRAVARRGRDAVGSIGQRSGRPAEQRTGERTGAAHKGVDQGVAELQDRGHGRRHRLHDRRQRGCAGVDDGLSVWGDNRTDNPIGGLSNRGRHRCHGLGHGRHHRRDRGRHPIHHRRWGLDDRRDGRLDRVHRRIRRGRHCVPRRLRRRLEGIRDRRRRIGRGASGPRRRRRHGLDDPLRRTDHAADRPRGLGPRRLGEQLHDHDRAQPEPQHAGGPQQRALHARGPHGWAVHQHRPAV